MTVAAPRRTWTHSTTAKDSAVGPRRSTGKFLKMDSKERASHAHPCTGAAWKSFLSCRPLSQHCQALGLKDASGST
ncbi:sodium/potassium-transporting ATPase subunit gamma isoform X2 [Muntiacus reevesi]|uniref:sodium/potassium-transporting ATPase subunit gamma isoform X2 n=1 Tax=Muntiacus reevesi TaxID=9886 RepID=UPI003307A6B5